MTDEDYRKLQDIVSRIRNTELGSVSTEAFPLLAEIDTMFWKFADDIEKKINKAREERDAE